MAWLNTLPFILAQAQAQVAAAEPAADAGLSPAVLLLIAVGVFVGSFMLGNFIGRALRMPDYGFKIGIVLFTIIGSIAVNILGWPPKRGIDLSGGVVLVYEVDRELSQPDSLPGILSAFSE